MENYAIYLRKSRADLEAEQRGEGDTLKKHETALMGLAKSMHLNIVKIYREIVSGDSIASRPEVQKLLEEVGKGIYNGVLVMEVPRLARGDTIDQGIVAQTFLYSGTKIVTPGKTYDPASDFDQEYFEFGLFMSRREYKTINRRMQAGIRACVEGGQYMGSIPPYGFDLEFIKSEHIHTLKENPKESSILKLIYSLRIVGIQNEKGEFQRLGFLRTANYLNELGYRTRTGKLWTPSMIKDIIDRVENYGMIASGNRKTMKKIVDGKVIESRPRNKDTKIYPGLHKGIITKEEFDLAHNTPPSSSPGGYELQNPFAGLMYCKKCGKIMTRRKSTDKKGNKQYSIMCDTYGCNCVSSYINVVETAVLDALQSWITGYKLKFDNTVFTTKTTDIKMDLLKQIDLETEKLKKQKERIYEFYETGEYDSDTFLRRSKAIAQSIEEKKLQRKRLETEIVEEKKQEESRKNIVPKVETLLDIYEQIPTAKEKNDMLKDILEKIVYWKTGNNRWDKKYNIELKLYPKLPKKEL